MHKWARRKKAADAPAVNHASVKKVADVVPVEHALVKTAPAVVRAVVQQVAAAKKAVANKGAVRPVVVKQGAATAAEAVGVDAASPMNKLSN